MKQKDEKVALPFGSATFYIVTNYIVDAIIIYWERIFYEKNKNNMYIGTSNR